MVALNKLKRSFVTRVYVHADIPEDDHIDAPHITMDSGHLDVGGLVIPKPKYHDDLSLIQWQHHVRGFYHSGKLHLNKERTLLTGHIVSGEHHSTAKMTTFVGYIAPTTYTTKLTRNGKNKTGPDVTIGYKMDPTTHFPTEIFKIDETETEVTVTFDSKTSVTTYTVLVSGQTTQYAQLDANYPVSAVINMRFDGMHFEGTFVPWDADTQKPAAKALKWTGDAPKATVRCTPPVNLFTESHEQAQEQFVAEQQQQLEFSPPAPKMAMFMALPPKAIAAVDDSLSVMELFGMSQPPAGVQDMSQKFLIRNMKYYMKEAWLKNFFGEQRPLIPADDPVMSTIKAKGAKEFYGSDFAVAYLGQVFYQHPPPNTPTKISKADAMKLKYHMTNGLAKNQVYNSQTSALYLEAFLYEQDRLKAYIADQKVREKQDAKDKDYWANQLFNVLTSPQQINIMVTRIINHVGGDPNVEFKMYGTILNLLQPSGDLSGQMMQILVTAVTGKMSQNINDTDKTSINRWITDVIKQFIKDFEVDPADPTDEKQLARQAQADALKQAAEIIGNVEGLGGALADIIAAVKSPAFGTFGKIKEMMDKIKLKYPKIAKWSGTALNVLGKAFTALAYAGGVFTLIMAYKGWDKLDPAKKAQAIVDTVYLAGQLAIDLPKAISFIGPKAIELLKSVGNFFSRFDICQRIGGFFSRMATKVGDWLAELAESLSRYFPRAAGRIVVEAGDLLMELYSKLPRALEFLGPVVSLAACAVSTYSFVKDLIDGAPTMQTALDGVQAVAALMETIFLVVGLLVETSWAGPLAALFAIIGLVAALVLMFNPPKPPPTPAEVFITGDLKTYLAKLEAPPADWKEPDAAKDKKKKKKKKK